MALPAQRHHRFFFGKLGADRRGVTAVEAALILPVFLVFLLVLFEVSYDQFVQGLLESALQITSYQVQTGNTTNTADGPTFIKTDFCPNAIAGLLNCKGIYVRVQEFNSTSCTDFYTAVDGNRPITGKTLELGNFVGEQGTGSGTTTGPVNCEDSTTNAGIGFCNAGPNQYIIMTAIYITPSFINSLLPGQGYTYGGHFVHAAFATSAFFTENFALPAVPNGATVAGAC